MAGRLSDVIAKMVGRRTNGEVKRQAKVSEQAEQDAKHALEAQRQVLARAKGLGIEVRGRDRLRAEARVRHP